jgi:hypothetical protein
VEEICEVLLSKRLVVPALKVASSCRNHGGDHLLPVRKFLEAALEDPDDTVFPNVFNHFQSRNLIPGGCYQEYLDKYRSRSANHHQEEE